MEAIIRTSHLTKRFRQHIAVNELTLDVYPGEIFGFLGPNGAGKTTTIMMLTGMIRPTSGKLEIGGKDPVVEPIAVKRMVGVIPDRPYVYEKLTGREFLRFVGGIYGLDPAESDPRLEQLLNRFGLQRWGDELVEGYSHGMRQRLVMCGALLHDPRLLIIDEPMVGLDPSGARLVKEIFRELRDRGTTIFLSTHSLDVAEEVSDRVGIIYGGRLLTVGTIPELKTIAKQDGRLEALFLKITTEAAANDDGGIV